MPKNQETYLKNAYEFIYGKEGEQLYKKKMDVKTKPSEKKKAACAVTMAQAAVLPSGKIIEVAVKHQL